MPRRRYLDKAAPADSMIITDADLEGTDWYWDYPSAVHFTDPLAHTTKGRDEKFLFNKHTGYLVPKSQVLAYANSKQHLPEVVHTLNNKDKYTLNVVNRLFGNNKHHLYNSLRTRNDDFFKEIRRDYDDNYVDTLFSPNDFIAKLDTITNKSKNPKLVLSSGVSELKKMLPNNVMRDGRVRAFTYPIIPGAPIFLDNKGRNFLGDYISELSHTYQFNNNEDRLKKINIKGDYPIAGVVNQAVREDSYNKPGYTEYNAHRLVEPALIDYLASPPEYYNDWNDASETYGNMLDYIILRNAWDNAMRSHNTKTIQSLRGRMLNTRKKQGM